MGQERYLRGCTFVRASYRAPRPGWDHDHCEFCSAKFTQVPAPGVLTDGYRTVDADHRWVCDACFADFAEEFDFHIAPGNSGST